MEPLWAAMVGAHGALAMAFDAAVPTPYMDEVFHVRMAQAYCALRLDEWDAKVTTFPGLYIVASAAAHVASGVGRLLGAGGVRPSVLCRLRNLRAINALAGALVPVACYRLLRVRHPRAGRATVALNALAMALVPASFFFHFLFYTDTIATLLVLLGLLCTQRRAFEAAAAPLAVAVSIRQTNAVWALFALCVAAIDATDAVARAARVHAGSTGSLVSEVSWRVRALARLEPRALVRLAPLGAIVGSFAIFVVVNGGVVVGDRSHHVPGLHFAQVLYACAFCACFGDPAKFTTHGPSTVRALGSRARAHPRVAAAALALALGAVRWGTMCHPFLLADNRHYTFYVWKDLLRRPVVRYGAALGYVPCAALVWDALGEQSALWRLAFVGCSALVLVPSPLLELRYFALPFLVLRLHAPLLTGARELVPALALSAGVNALTIGVFLLRPWRWPDGSEARFIW
ncbi:hypothetical protein KFE25_009393 [Diacronema lutheri]|uniref:Dol-P-Glc:Glc(2)Man(9)GlcNAc(2)-PP-Dol alpha-1,2-glucosyltransferase n=1 Tax=Diacronema lutheri TaxID=2081491 RepID=A0A8J5XYR9_DIALT|nr:hypothetical protein KFE25_009393 [Diacronema lutheri]